MPIYEYNCKNCGKGFEILQKFSDPPPLKCPLCSGEVSKLISQCAFHLKGTGWYATDYARLSQKLRRVMILSLVLPKNQRINFTGSIYLSLFHIAYLNHSKTAIPILTFYKSVLIAGKKRGGNPPRCTPPLFKKYTGYTDECYASRIASASSL